jgi:hypothetical protein
MLTYAYVQEGALEAVAETLSRHCVRCRMLTYADCMLTYAYVQEGALEAVAETLSRHCVCWRMLPYADVCCRMLTDASQKTLRMLTYADVC